MSMLDFFTGGKSGDAEDDLKKALAAIQAIKTPTKEELTLPQLEQYVNAGILTPSQASAVLQSQNAYDNVSVNPSSREAEMTALNQLQDVASSSGMTASMRAQLSDALDKANTNTQGTRGSILDSMAQRGVPTSLMGEAAQLAASSQDARTANLSGTQAAGQAEQNALMAMANSGGLASNIHGQDYAEQAQKAQAQNAINLWNAQNQSQMNQFNANNQNQANMLNTQNAQGISNANIQNANQRTAYNTQLPQQMFGNSMAKAGAEAGAYGNMAGLAQQQGQQNAGIWGGIIGSLMPQTILGGPSTGAPGTWGTGAGATPNAAGGGGGGGMAGAGAAGGAGAMAGGGGGASAADSAIMLASEGGKVPGHAEVPGNSYQNDTVPARLSPGEVVVPRTIAPHPDMVKNFVSHLMKQRQPVKPMHPEDLKGMMDAMSRRREGNA